MKGEEYDAEATAELRKLMDRTKIYDLGGEWVSSIGDLLKRAADPNVRTLVGGRTPLMFSAWNGDVEAVRLLLDAGADAKAKDNPCCEGYTCSALGLPHEEISAGKAQRITKLLLRAGADPNTIGYENNSVLQDAVGADNFPVAKMLVDAGADVDYQNNDGTTALMGAASIKSLRLVKFLLERGADPELMDHEGGVALMDACRHNHYSHCYEGGKLTRWKYEVQEAAAKIVQELLAAGADTSAKNSDGKTAMDFTSEEDPLVRQALLSNNKS